MQVHLPARGNGGMDPAPALYMIRISGPPGPAAVATPEPLQGQGFGHCCYAELRAVIGLLASCTDGAAGARTPAPLTKAATGQEHAMRLSLDPPMTLKAGSRSRRS